MSASTAGETVAVPVGFFCEHAAGPSRILVLLQRRGHTPAAHTVLGGLDPRAAEEIGDLLRRAAGGGPVSELSTAVEQVSSGLVGEQVEVLRRAVQWAGARRWPVATDALRPLPARHDDGDRTSDRQVDIAPRLADLPGRVVRVTRLLEVHVPDPAAFLAWMREGGWEPAPGGHLGDDDPDDLIGAVMTATDEVPPLVGACLVTEASQAEFLEPARGDELLDWSDIPVVADFGTGWRQHPTDATD